MNKQAKEKVIQLYLPNTFLPSWLVLHNDNVTFPLHVSSRELKYSALE